jgi:hypothetical protein
MELNRTLSVTPSAPARIAQGAGPGNPTDYARDRKEEKQVLEARKIIGPSWSALTMCENLSKFLNNGYHSDDPDHRQPVDPALPINPELYSTMVRLSKESTVTPADRAKLPLVVVDVSTKGIVPGACVADALQELFQEAIACTIFYFPPGKYTITKPITIAKTKNRRAGVDTIMILGEMKRKTPSDGTIFECTLDGTFVVDNTIVIHGVGFSQLQQFEPPDEDKKGL